MRLSPSGGEFTVEYDFDDLVDVSQRFTNVNISMLPRDNLAKRFTGLHALKNCNRIFCCLFASKKIVVDCRIEISHIV
jgi:hypothetical protein